MVTAGIYLAANLRGNGENSDYSELNVSCDGVADARTATDAEYEDRKIEAK